MQLISWQMARLGSRFSLFFEPHYRRVMHSALGRLLDQPLSLMVGLVEPDGTERALPFCARGEPFYNPEQFERVNSITFRGYSPGYRLRFEFNVHSVFYPQDEQLCLMPAFYLEMRVNPVENIRDTKPAAMTPARVKLFLRLQRPDTQIQGAIVADQARIDLSYRHLAPQTSESVEINERIVSLNAGAEIDADGQGMSLTLPVTEVGSGTKWRLVWGAFCGGNIMPAATHSPSDSGRFRYTQHWRDLDSVMHDAVLNRDYRLAYSRRLEKAIEQAPLRMAQRHLIHQSLQNFLGNTFWIQRDNGSAWFGTRMGNQPHPPTFEEEGFHAMFYLTMWPDLLAMQFDRWALQAQPHKASGGAVMAHPDTSPVEQNAYFMLLLQTYCHWSGQLEAIQRHAALIQRLATYLKWTDHKASGIPSEGIRPAPHQQDLFVGGTPTTVAVTRVAGLKAAADLLSLLGNHADSEQYDAIARKAVGQINEAAWLGDHYALSVDQAAVHAEPWTDPYLPLEPNTAREAYSINTFSALLLPMLIAQPLLFHDDRVVQDITGALRETLGPYGCTASSIESEHISVSHNLWRDHFAKYTGMSAPAFTQCYWDLQTMSNTMGQSMGYADSYLSANHCFSPRGIASIGYLLGYPRLMVDRLAPDGSRFSINPDRHFVQRWPLLPLADWRGGKIPVCVVDLKGQVTVENDIDPIFIRGDGSRNEQPRDALIG